MTFTNIPAKLKSADIHRFAQRAVQVEKVKPVIAYWCYYWILNQILSNQLQSADAECTQYATNLMDTLEQMKAQNASEDAVNDELAGQAYVEQFGNETFQRAENAMRANKASRQTAETFLAAAIFLELLQIWSALPSEMASKVKFAKFHALRIVRAVKAGEDPNLSNPAPEQAGGADEVELDPNDPDVQKINGTRHQQPYVEEADDGGGEGLSGGPAIPGLPHRNPYQETPPESQTPTVGEPAPSTSTDYFPSTSHIPGQAPEAGDPPSIPPSPSAPPEDDDPSSFYASAPPPSAISPLPSVQAPSSLPSRPRQPPPPAARAPPRQPSQVQPPISTSYDPQADDLAVAEAQKHARWAISALNFEDVGTAVKELRLALEKLGAP